MRKLPSGRFQAAYLDDRGRRRPADTTFATRADADRWLAVTRTSILEGRWTDPEKGKETLGPYVEKWIRQRHGLRPRTIDLYEWLARKYIVPQLGRSELRRLTPEVIRSWRAKLAREGASQSTLAKSYRLLRTVLATAVDDDIILRNPCRIRNGGQDHYVERPVLTVDQVFALADRTPERYRALMLLTTFASLRFGEVSALKRRDIDLDAGTVTVRAAFVDIRGKGLTLSQPKSRAGYRTIGVPRQIADELRSHLEQYVSPEAEAFVFTGPKGAVFRRGNFNKLTRWEENIAALGLEGLHFHDLRHTGNVFAARVPGTSTRDLMQRMGHDSMRAAMIYQHAADDAQTRIASGLSMHLDDVRGEKPSATVARMLHTDSKADAAEEGSDAAGQ